MASNETTPASSVTPPSLVPPGVTFDATLGANFIGLVIASVFYGVTLLQTVIYVSTYFKRDRWFLRSLVLAIWILDTLSLAMYSHGCYHYLITNYANPIAAASFVWSIESEPITTIVISLFVRLFQCYRIRNLGATSTSTIWTWCASIIAVISLVPFAVGIYATWFVNANAQQLSENVSELKWMAIVSNTFASALDLSIPIAICILLYQARGEFSMDSTQKLTTMVSLYLISSGLLTTVVIMGTMISYLAFPTTLIFQAFSASGAKAYTNAFMATLNVRDHIRSSQVHSIGIPESIQFRQGKSNLSSTLPGPGIAVATATDVSEYGIPLSNRLKHTRYEDSSASEFHKA